MSSNIICNDQEQDVSFSPNREPSLEQLSRTQGRRSALTFLAPAAFVNPFSDWPLVSWLFIVASWVIADPSKPLEPLKAAQDR